jgi:hypothetical protein
VLPALLSVRYRTNRTLSLGLTQRIRRPLRNPTVPPNLDLAEDEDSDHKDCFLIWDKPPNSNRRYQSRFVGIPVPPPPYRWMSPNHHIQPDYSITASPPWIETHLKTCPARIKRTRGTTPLAATGHAHFQRRPMSSDTPTVPCCQKRCERESSLMVIAAPPPPKSNQITQPTWAANGGVRCRAVWNNWNTPFSRKKICR